MKEEKEKANDEEEQKVRSILLRTRASRRKKSFLNASEASRSPGETTLGQALQDITGTSYTELMV